MAWLISQDCCPVASISIECTDLVLNISQEVCQSALDSWTRFPSSPGQLLGWLPSSLLALSDARQASVQHPEELETLYKSYHSCLHG